MSGKDRTAGGLLPPIELQSQPRFYVEKGVVLDRVDTRVRATNPDLACDLLNKMQGEIAELRSLDAEWWTLASGEGVGTPTRADSDRVTSKIALMRSRFYDRGMRAGIQSVAAEIATWLKTPAADRVCGNASRTTRHLIADAIERSEWRKR